MKKVVVYIALSTIFFSTMEISLKLFSLGFNALQMNFIRFFIGSLLLLPLGIRGLNSRGVRLIAADFGFFALTGFLCVVVSMTFYQLAVVSTQASVVAILFSCNPVFVVPFAWLLLGERIRKITVLSMLLSLAGIVCILNPFKMSVSMSGVILTLLAAASFAFYGVVSKRKSERYGSVALTACSFLAGSMELLALILFSKIGFIASALRGAGLKDFADIHILQGITLQSLPGLLYIGVCVTGLGYVFYLLSMENASTAVASTVFFIKPALAPVLAFFILREPITVNMFIGILLIVSGSLVTLLQGMKQNAACVENIDLPAGEDEETE